MVGKDMIESRATKAPDIPRGEGALEGSEYGVQRVRYGAF